MKLELTLLELNELYYATGKLVEQNQKHLDELGQNISSINYFKTQLSRSEALRDKIQTALYDEAKELDEARDFVEKKQRDYSAFEKYADRLTDTQSEDKKLFTLNENR
jgi:hypothetical protein